MAEASYGINGSSHTYSVESDDDLVTQDELTAAIAGVEAGSGIDQATLDAAVATLQPLDSDLTAIAALTTTSFGRALLALADAAAGRTSLGLGTAATSASTDFDAAGAAAAAQAASQPLDSDLTAIAALTTTSFGRAFLALADAAAGRTALGLGTAATHNTGDYDAAGAAAAAQSASQPLDGELTALAGLTSAANALPYFTGSGTASVTTLSAFIRTLLDDADAATAQATLGLGSAATQATSAFAQTANNLSDVTASTARTNLGLGSLATKSAVASSDITDGTIVNADISSSAAITYSRLSLGSSIVSADITDGTIVDGDLAANTLSASLPNFGTCFATPLMSSVTTATATANQTYYALVIVPCKATLTGATYTCIASGSGNVRSSLYNSAGTRVANRTSNVACVGLTIQQIGFDSTYLAVPGVYYLSVTFSSGTTTYSTATSPLGGNVAGAGSGATATSITAPTTPTGAPAMSTY